MKLKHIILLFALFSVVSISDICSQIKLEPTFHSCSVYIPAEKYTNCLVEYKNSQNNEWKAAYEPFYDSMNNEFRVSIVRLDEDTEYMVRVTLSSEKMKKKELKSECRTWTSTPPIAKVIKVSSLKRDQNNGLKIMNLSGKADGWIKIVGDVPINADNSKETAILIDNCKYLIFDGLSVTGGGRHCIKTGERASDIRFINCDISKWGRIPVHQKENGHFIDKTGKEINNDGGFTLYKSKNIVLERCFIHDPNGYTNPWNGIVEMGEFKGQPYRFAHPQGPNAVYIMQSGGGTVLRYNDFVGSQTHRYNDPVEGWQNRDVAGGFAKDADIYGNVMAFGQDDGIELDGGQCNIRVFDNRIEQIYCGISTAPNVKGPSYIFNNVIWNMGNSLGLTGNAIKNGGGHTFTKGMQYLFNNTIIHNAGGMIGVGYGNDDNRELFNAVTRNNIFFSQMYIKNKLGKGRGYGIYDAHLNQNCDFDYDMIGNQTDPDGVGVIHATDGSEKNGIFASPSFVNLEDGILTLDTKDKGIGKGLHLNNFTETYQGDAPHMGAFGTKSSSLFPMRPINLEADKYHVRIVNGASSYITIKAGEIEASEFEIKMSEDMKNWLKVETDTQTVNAQSNTVLKLTAEKAPYLRNGMIFFRLKNGFSVPITVEAD